MRYSEAKSRNYENEQGQKHIWHRYNREKEMIEQGSEREVANITLDVWDKNEFDPEEHRFIFLTERLIREETYSKGDQKIWIGGDGRYSGPLAEYVDNWDVIFQDATETSSPSLSTPSINGSGSGLQGDRGSVNGDTSGTISESQRIQVRVSEKFKRQVYERFSHRCMSTVVGAGSQNSSNT